MLTSKHLCRSPCRQGPQGCVEEVLFMFNVVMLSLAFAPQ